MIRKLSVWAAAFLAIWAVVSCSSKKVDENEQRRQQIDSIADAKVDSLSGAVEKMMADTAKPASPETAQDVKKKK